MSTLQQPRHRPHMHRWRERTPAQAIARWVLRRPACSAALAVLLGASFALTLAHHVQTTPLPSGAAVHAVLHDRGSAALLRGAHWNQVTASGIDGQLERVSFTAGGRIVAQFAVDRSGHVVQGVNFSRVSVPYGNPGAYSPLMLLGLSVLFVLVAAVTPLRRIRNLDVAAALSLLAPVVLLQDRYLDASVLSAVPAMLYLLGRCLWTALGPERTVSPSTPLVHHLTAGWVATQRVHVMRMVLFALALIFVVVGMSSTHPVDVATAVMEGATKVVHGVLPYGHMPGDVLHGDTYPLLSYVAYAPLASVAPVHSVWDSVDGALAIAILAALVTAAAICRQLAGGWRSRFSDLPPQASQRGLQAALTWLSFPPLLIVVSTGTTDVVLAAILLFAVILWHRPAASTAMLAIAGWFKLAPFALLPIWLAPLRGRRLGAALGGVAVVSGVMIALLLALGGIGGARAMVRAVSYQFSRGSPQSAWSALNIEWLQPIAEAGLLALIAGASVRMRTAHELARDGARVAALSAAVLIGLQLVADYWAFLYLVWVVPLLTLSLLESPTRRAAAEREPIRRRSDAVAVAA